MSSKQRRGGLGRGLGALIPTAPPPRPTPPGEATPDAGGPVDRVVDALDGSVAGDIATRDGTGAVAVVHNFSNCPPYFIAIRGRTLETT